MLTIYTAYELGYRAVIASQPRKVPGSVRNVLPSLSPEWFRGYDDARRASAAERAQMLTKFVSSLEALTVEPISK